MSASPANRLNLPAPPRSVLVVITRRIGDVLLATPVLGSLKRAWPHAQIDVLVFEGTQGFVTANAHVKRVITVPERPSLGKHLKLAASIVRRYDLALSLVPGDRPTLYAYLAGRRRAGLLVQSHKEGWKRRLLDAWVPFDNDATHTVRMHLALLDVVGVQPLAEVQPTWSADDQSQAQSLLGPLVTARYAVMHPYPKFRYKMWTQDGWAALARWLQDHGIAVVLTGGPDAAERDYIAAIAARAPGAVDLSGKLSLGGVAYAISRAAVFVGPDTAITHAAAALGVPTVALFGPSNPVKWGPWPAGHDANENPWQLTGSQRKGRVRLVQGAGPCVPCRNEGCDKHLESDSRCLTTMSASTVIAAVEEVLAS
jgi:heptosyltransferase-3